MLEDRVVLSTWTVANTSASGAGSLLQAAANADADTSPAIIQFDSTVFASSRTITLTASLVLSNATEPITILGPTTSTVIISGEDLSIQGAPPASRT